MVEAESDGEREAEPRRKPRRDDYMDHEDRQRQPKTRDQRRTSLDERRQETRDRKWRQNIEVEVPSWSSIVKPLQPKFLRTDEYKSKYRSKLISTHGGKKEVSKILKIPNPQKGQGVPQKFTWVQG